MIKRNLVGRHFFLFFFSIFSSLWVAFPRAVADIHRQSKSIHHRTIKFQNIVLRRHEPFPVPMPLPHLCHILNWYVLSFRHKHIDEDCHNSHQSCKENEEARLKAAKHAEKDLCNKKGE